MSDDVFFSRLREHVMSKYTPEQRAQMAAADAVEQARPRRKKKTGARRQRTGLSVRDIDRLAVGIMAAVLREDGELTSGAEDDQDAVDAACLLWARVKERIR